MGSIQDSIQAFGWNIELKTLSWKLDSERVHCRVIEANSSSDSPDNPRMIAHGVGESEEAALRDAWRQIQSRLKPDEEDDEDFDWRGAFYQHSDGLRIKRVEHLDNFWYSRWPVEGRDD